MATRWMEDKAKKERKNRHVAMGLQIGRIPVAP
jgi:hypothetical protein